MNHKTKTALCFVVSALIVLLVGCDRKPPEYIERCLESHTETKTEAVPKLFAPGMPSIGGMVYAPRTRIICDKSETVKNPKYEQWLDRTPANAR